MSSFRALRDEPRFVRWATAETISIGSALLLVACAGWAAMAFHRGATTAPSP